MTNTMVADKNKLERDAIDREVEEACKAYRARDEQLAREWRAAEGRLCATTTEDSSAGE